MMQQQPHRRGPTSGQAMMEGKESMREDVISNMLSHHTTNLPGIERRMGGLYKDIALRSLLLTLPMIIFVCVLLIVVFHYQVQSKGYPFENLRLHGQQDEKGFYYVNIGSTRFVYIASLSSRLSPYLASSALALIAYLVAKTHLRDVRGKQTGKLPTPYQLFLTLRFFDGGGSGALWSWAEYLFKWRKERRLQASPLSITALIAALSTILAMGIFLADSWLHITTKSISFIEVTEITEGVDYSLVLLPECTTGNNSFSSYSYCTLSPTIHGNILVNPTQSILVLNNVSATMAVFQYENTPYTYLGIPSSKNLTARDYTATTYGMQTQCKPVSNECGLNGNVGAYTPFHCTDAFSGDVTGAQNTWVMSYFTDATMESNETYDGIENPYYFGIAAIVNAEGEAGPLVATNLTAIPEIVTPTHGGIAFVLFCATTLYDIVYDSVNGSVTRFVTTASNASVANIWQSVMALSLGNIGLPNLLQSSTVAVFSESAQELADKMALAYSRVALAVGAEAVEPRPAVRAQERRSSLVTRVPVAPLFTLVAANLLFVVMGLILTFIALASSGGEVREIQSRLSIKGLVADRFESPRGWNGVESMEDLFEESEGRGSMRVGLDHAEGGGYSYRTWPKQ